MSKKTTAVFIVIFILIGTIILGLYLWLNKKDKPVVQEEETPWYQGFNPFGSGNEEQNNIQKETNNINNKNTNTQTETTKTSKFYQVTDFAVAGATFLMDERPIINPSNNPAPEPVKVIISADTKEGRKEIQEILNKTLSLNPPLVVDGSFGKLATSAIKSFQKLNNLPTTGLIDTATAPLFTKEATEASPQKTTEQVPSLRYVEKMNGHIYKTFLDTKAKEKISNTTIPAIYEVFFDKSGNTVIYRYISEDGLINTFMATLGASKGEFLTQGISDLSVSKDKTKFFYLVENSNGVTGTIVTFGGIKRDVVFNYPFTEWLSSWSNNGVFLTTKASSGINGSIFSLNSTNKTIGKIFGGVPGLTTLISPNGLFILYGSSKGEGSSFGVFDVIKHTTKDLGVGLPEKCIWSNDNVNVYCAVPNVMAGYQYPDLWYQGLVSFDDSFVKINTITGDKTTIANSIEETAIDGTSLFLDDKESLLFFINKKDSTLWSLDLK